MHVAYEGYVQREREKKGIEIVREEASNVLTVDKASIGDLLTFFSSNGWISIRILLFWIDHYQLFGKYGCYTHMSFDGGVFDASVLVHLFSLSISFLTPYNLCTYDLAHYIHALCI